MGLAVSLVHLHRAAEEADRRRPRGLHFAQARPSAYLPAVMRFWTFHCARSMAATWPLVLQET